MAKPRSSLISLSDTPYYHIVARCVRRSYLCGQDIVSGQNFEHRRLWLVERIKFLASIFCIDVAAYAIMSNHYHLVLRVNSEKANLLSQPDVLNRWHQLCQPKPIIARCQSQAKSPSKSEQLVIDNCALTYRERLINISWFMRFLNEFIARKANLEDNCTGRFWEGRFKSQALLDEVSVLACMAYVDLNPIRAKMAKTPETSDFTSIQERLGIQPKSTCHEPDSDSTLDNRVKSIAQASLLPFVKTMNESVPNVKREANHIPFSLIDYCELVDWTGRQIRRDKRGYIAGNEPSIITRLGLTDESWLKLTTGIESLFSHSVGQKFQLQRYANNHHLRRVKGLQKVNLNSQPY